MANTKKITLDSVYEKALNILTSNEVEFDELKVQAEFKLSNGNKKFEVYLKTYIDDEVRKEK